MAAAVVSGGTGSLSVRIARAASAASAALICSKSIARSFSVADQLSTMSSCSSWRASSALRATSAPVSASAARRSAGFRPGLFAVAAHAGRHHVDHVFEIFGIAPEHRKDLVIERQMFGPVDQHRAQGVIEIHLAAEPGRGDGAHRILDLGGADSDPGRAQRAG
jgi:hypothetical protein